MIRPPCKGCRFRRVRPNCHATCEAYLDFSARLSAAREARRKDRAIASYIVRIQKNFGKKENER